MLSMGINLLVKCFAAQSPINDQTYRKQEYNGNKRTSTLDGGDRLGDRMDRGYFHLPEFFLLNEIQKIISFLAEI